MFHRRYGRKGGEGIYGRNIRGFFVSALIVFAGGSSGPAFRAGFFVNICREEGR